MSDYPVIFVKKKIYGTERPEKIGWCMDRCWKRGLLQSGHGDDFFMSYAV